MNFIYKLLSQYTHTHARPFLFITMLPSLTNSGVSRLGITPRQRRFAARQFDLSINSAATAVLKDTWFPSNKRNYKFNAFDALRVGKYTREVLGRVRRWTASNRGRIECRRPKKIVREGGRGWRAQRARDLVPHGPLTTTVRWRPSLYSLHIFLFVLPLVRAATRSLCSASSISRFRRELHGTATVTMINRRTFVSR